MRSKTRDGLQGRRLGLRARMYLPHVAHALSSARPFLAAYVIIARNQSPPIRGYRHCSDGHILIRH